MTLVKFILNDETKINQKGFRILNSGLDLERFRANPVILDQHTNAINGVIGRWKNITIEGNLLTAEADFDLKSEIGKKVSQQVKDGFIRGCSLGIDALSQENFILDSNGDVVLKRGEIYEASIVAIPNNAKCLVKLYASTKNITPQEEQELFKNIKNYNPMNEILLSVTAAYTALGYTEAKKLTSSDIETGVLKLKAELDSAKSERDSYKQKYNELNQEKEQEQIKLAAQLVDEAIKAGKIDATKREKYQNFALTDLELFKDIIDKKTGKQNLSAQVENQGYGSGYIKNLDDFQKLKTSEQLEFKTNFPEEYRRITQ